MTTTTSPNEFESRIDTQLADLYEARSKESYYLSSSIRTLAWALGHRETRTTPLPDLDALLAEAATTAPHPNLTTGLNGVEEHIANIKRIRSEERVFEAQYTGWSRFFLCTNHNGHIHRDMNCSTCRWDTEFAWLPEMSGLTETDAVEAHGCILCSVCYPSAPVEWTNGISKADQAAKDERAAAKTEREAAKAAKAITSPDGTPLKDMTGYTVKTEVTARRELSDAFFNLLLGYNEDKYTTYADRLIEAIAAKTGESAESLKAEYKTKAAKKYKKEMS